jgi:hypothetical protein
VGYTVAVVVLAAGVPLFLCMPPWNDVTLHDMVVRTILRGGVVYRDVFDTNLPGIDWCMALVRAVFGWSYEALRAVDLFVIGASVAVLCGWVRRCGGTGYAVAWFVAAAALFYPFLSEFSHVQRDPWMLLPAIVAARLRLKRVRGKSTRDPTPLLPSVKPTPPGPPSLKGGGETKSAEEHPALSSASSSSPPPFREGGGVGLTNARERAEAESSFSPPPFREGGPGGVGSCTVREDAAAHIRLPSSSPPLAAVPRVHGRLHPLAAAYRLDVLPAVRALLAADRLRMTDLFDAVPTRFFEANELAHLDPDFRALRNVNTPEEYAAALRELDRP